MSQTIEEQMAIMKAYADGQPVWRRPSYRDVGERVTEKEHQFNFEDSFYSLTPLDWCTGKQAIEAYDSFMRNGSESDGAPMQYRVTVSVISDQDGQNSNYEKKAMDSVDTFAIFIAGAEWAIRNKDTGIDFRQSLNDFREKAKTRQDELKWEIEHAR